MMGSMYFEKENYYTNICSALANVSKTLTTLDVSFGWRETDDEFRLYHILSAFQNLTSLRIHAPRNRFLVGSSMPIAGIHRLTKLTLDTIIDPVGLKMVLETFPYLRWLSLPTHDDMTFRSIQQYGTNSINVLLTGGLPDALTCGGLLLSRKFSWLIPDEEKFLNNNDGSSSNQGIRWLSTGFIRSEREAGSSIVTYIEAHHATIQILSLNMIKDFSDATHWHSLCSSEQTLVHLTHLNLEAIEDDDDHDYTIFPDLELLLNNQVPNLQVFSLFSVADRMTKGTFDALGNIQTLRELWLRDVTFDAYDLNKFLNDMASKQSSLTGLCLIQCDDNMDDHILETCTRIQSLSHLIIQNHWATQPECIRKFIQNVASALPKLKELSLHQFNLTPKDLQVLNNSSTLKSVEFSAVVGVDEDQVKESFSSPSIQVKFMSAETYFNIYTPI
ncbi:hypothetical protein BDA99DRAFT_88662 [Phascolomyces articulosus]|uniref:Uncharacterized protein n=1 Tax=Phascolomyces articulosus TaxID=60185 RepID=A0AAD5PDF7_9FUNG|nr:hypothetical protein BDA99DRAFT_88662 [Phascolomyces articulosus]